VARKALVRIPERAAALGDRIVVIYGAGHEFLLRRCIREMPGYKLVEANDYLPQ
jgi:hypothetical protein